MQEFRNASKGLNIVFSSRILILLFAMVSVVSGNVFSLFNGSVKIILIIATLVAALLTIGAVTLYLVGLNIASKDSKDYKVPLKIEIASLVFMIVGAVLEALPLESVFGSASTNIYPTVSLVSEIFDLFVVYFVISTTSKLLEKSYCSDYANAGRKIFIMYVISFVVSKAIDIILDVVPNFYDKINSVTITVVPLLTFALFVFTIVYNVMYLVYIKKSANRLAKKG